MLDGMKESIRTSALLACAALLAACGTQRSVVVQRTGAMPPPGRYAATPAVTASSGATYRVTKGDTLYSIAFRHGKDFRDVARWNGIAAPYTIWPGQELVMQPPSGSAARPSPSRPVASVPVPSPHAVSPPDNPAREHVDHERDVDEAGPCRDVREVRHPQLIRAGRDELALDEVQRTLRDLGHEVLEAKDAREGLRVIQETDAAVELALVDFAMPGMNGAEFVVAAREISPQLPVILLTGYVAPDVVPPDVALMHKPFTPKGLQKAIDTALG